jgi:hypothetical protein
MDGVCTWCGRKLAWEAKYRGKVISVLFRPHQTDFKEEIDVGFCCAGCAWSWHYQEHTTIYQMKPADARAHLVLSHGLPYPPGDPAGKQSPECLDYFDRKTRMLITAKLTKELTFY